MRSSFAEWLLLTLLLFPLLAGVGFCLYARHDYRNQTERYRTEGESVVRELLADRSSPAGEIRDDFCHSYYRRLKLGELDGAQSFEWAVWNNGAVWCGPGDPVDKPWTVTDCFPAGLSPKALADASVRMRVELGAPPGTIEGADGPTRVFRDLADKPDLDALRDAVLPTAMKLYLLRRWNSEKFRATERMLELILAYQRIMRGRKRHLPAGRHDFGDLQVLSTKGIKPYLLLPPEFDSDEMVPFTKAMPVGEFARLTFGLTGLSGTPPHTVWRGWLSDPLSGEWCLSLTYGDAWWRAPFFSRWWVLVAAGMIALMLPPGLLFVSIRRRRRLDEARARFINEIAHDLRTPLTSLRLYSEMLASERTPEEDRGGYVDVIARESTRVSGLLANLLDLSRLERGERKLNVEHVDLDSATESALADFTALYPDRAEDVRVTGPDGAWVRADRTALGRILMNLLDNAGKFTAEGTPIRIAWGDSEPGRVCLTVSDEGPGIPPNERRRIFTRYARGSAATDGVQGTGLGLSLVRELTEAMGGTARLASSERGASFLIDLPGGVDG